MNVTVQFFAQVGVVAGKSSLQLELDGPCTAQELVARLASEHGERFRKLVLDADDRLLSTVLLVVGDRRVQWDSPFELNDRDTVLLATAIAGG